MKKKILLFCLSLLTALSLTACNFSSDDSSSNDSGSQSQNQSSDSGNTDSGNTDSGNTDSGNTDSGNTDSGNTDSGNSGDSSQEETHNYVSHDAVAATCEGEGNEAYYTCSDCDKIFDAEKQEIQAIPVISAAGHSYVFVEEKAGTCSTVGEIAHYACENCEKIFDMQKNEITGVASDYDEENHSSDLLIVAQTQPTKLVYEIGESFDPSGMTVVHKCADCEGETLDNLFLTYEYQTAGATAFAKDDTKITVKYNDLSFELSVTVNKVQAELSNVQETYATTCGVAPLIEAQSNVPEEPVSIVYLDGETEVQAEDFVAGKTYTAKVSIASTDIVEGTEKIATITVEHKHEWVNDEADWKKLNYACSCGDSKDFYALTYQAPYVDGDNLDVDLSAYVKGTEDFQIKSVQKVVRLQEDGSIKEAADGELVDIEYTNDGMVYTFSADDYENLTPPYKPYILTLSVVYTIGEIECPVIVEVKYVDKLVKTAEDLQVLAYTGADTEDKGGTANTGYYVLADDIDASGVIMLDTTLAWQDAIGFRGVFEGNGHTISGLNFGAWKYGLFGALGAGSKIQNVNFTNVSMGDGTTMFALVGRMANFTNVNIEFSVDTESSLLFDTANGCEFTNVTVKTCTGMALLAKVDEKEMTELPAGIAPSYYAQYMVTFNTDGGSAIDPVAVTVGKTVAKPTNPTKASDDNYDYTFAGWLLDGAEFNFDTPITAEIELVAQWTPTERLNETELIAAATNAIAALPESVTMPADFRYLSAISSANTLYNQLSDDGKAQVSNAAKLETLLAASKGYTAVYTPNADGVKAIPAVMHNNNASVGVTGALATDEAQGTIFVSTAGENGKAAIQFVNFPSVVGYDKIYFYVRSSVSGYLYMSDDTENDGWGTNWANNGGTITQYPIAKDVWTLISLDVSTNIISDDWAMSVWNTDIINQTLEIGVIVGCKLSEVPEEEPETPSEPELPADAVATGLTFGVFEDSGTTNKYGTVYNFTQGWTSEKDLGAFNKGALRGNLAEGHDSLRFYIYNPNTSDVVLYFMENETWARTDGATLKAGAWTEVVITPELIASNDTYLTYVSVESGAGTAGWQISTIYAVKA